PILVTNDLGQCWKCLGLGDDIDVGIRIGLPALASNNPAGMASTRSVAGTRHGRTEFTVGILRIFFQRAMRESLLITKFHAAEIQDAVLHRAAYALATAGFFALKQGGEDAGNQMDTRAGIANLSTGHHRKSVDLPSSGSSSAGAL